MTKPPEPQVSPIERVGNGNSGPAFLIFSLQGIGDSLEATSLIALLRDDMPCARIDVAVTRGSSAEFFRSLHPVVDDVIELPYWDRGRGAFLLSLLRQGRRRIYDASFMTYPSAKRAYHFVNLFFRARRKIGHRYARPRPWNLLTSYDELVPIRNVHNMVRNADLLVPLGARATNIRYVVPSTWKAEIPQLDNLVTLHVGTIGHDGFEHKRWPLESFTALGRALIADGYRVCVLAGPEEVAESEQLAAALPEVSTIFGSLSSVARHLRKSTLVITSDSGIGHLAAAIGTRTLGVFGPTPLNGAPYGPLSLPIRLSSCPPCFDPLTKGLPCKLNLDYRCIRNDVPVQFVLDRARAILAKASASGIR